MTCCQIGTYKCYLSLPAPLWSSKTHIAVDRCLAGEIFMLWGRGIVTTGCCCGHGQIDGYIGVEEEYIEKMLSMGYKIRQNETDPERRDSFYPMAMKKHYEEMDNGNKSREEDNIHDETLNLNEKLWNLSEYEIQQLKAEAAFFHPDFTEELYRVHSICKSEGEYKTATTPDGKEVTGYLFKSDVAGHCFILEHCNSYHDQHGNIRIANMEYHHVLKNTVKSIQETRNIKKEVIVCNRQTLLNTFNK